MLKCIFTVFLSLSFLTGILAAQAPVQKDYVFDRVKLLRQNGNSTEEISVIVAFREDFVEIQSKNLQQRFKYSEITAAEYSYSKSPRWKTGLGMGAASLLIPPLLFIAIPTGFSKHRRHWVTIKTENDFAVLKISKSSRKLFIPAFETKSGVTIQTMGEDK